MTEKIGGVEGTKLDVDFVDMERVSSYTCIVVYNILSCIKRILYIIQILKCLCLENGRNL